MSRMELVFNILVICLISFAQVLEIGGAEWQIRNESVTPSMGLFGLDLCESQRENSLLQRWWQLCHARSQQSGTKHGAEHRKTPELVPPGIARNWGAQVACGGRKCGALGLRLSFWFSLEKPAWQRVPRTEAPRGQVTCCVPLPTPLLSAVTLRKSFPGVQKRVSSPPPAAEWVNLADLTYF